MFGQYAVLFAQSNLTLTGTAKDTDGKAIEFADIVLLQKDSTVYKFSFVENGQFSLTQIDAGEYIIHVNSLDCIPFYQSMDLVGNTNVDLVLNRSGIALDEISITSRRKIFEVKDGNITFNIDKSMLKAEPSPMSIMSKLPFVQISPDGESIAVVGRGAALIYLNNQRIDLNRMNSISVDAIESIEIINNPSSKYESEGRSVILIKTKKDLQKGYKVGFSETLSQREFFNNFLGMNSSFKMTKAEFKLNLGYNALKPWEKVLTKYDVLNRNLSSESEGISIANRGEYILGAGCFYPIGDKDYFSIDYNTNLKRTTGDILAQTFFRLENAEADITTATGNRDERDYHNGILNYNNGFEKGNLFLGVQLSSFTQSLVTFIENSFNQASFEPEQNRNQAFGINSYSGRLDYETRFKSGAKIEMGWNSSLSNAQTKQVVSPVDNQEPEIRTDYEYDEQIHALYTQVSHPVGAVNFVGGMRVEKALVEGKFLDSSIPLIDRDNAYLLPKAQMSFQLDTLTSVTLDYARSIKRPNFSNLSQIEVYLNPFLVFSRNINLRPTTTHEIAANFQRKESSLRLSFTNQSNPVNWSTSYDESTDIFKTTLKNFEKSYGWSATLNVPYTYKKWTSFNTISLNWNKIEDENALQLASKPYVYFYTNHSFKLPGDWSFNCNAWGFTKRKEGAYERNALVIANAGISKVIFGKLSCTFNFNNILNNRSFEENSIVNSVQAFNGFFVDSRELSLSLKYSFGQIKSKYKNKNVNDNGNRVR